MEWVRSFAVPSQEGGAGRDARQRELLHSDHDELLLERFHLRGRGQGGGGVERAEGDEEWELGCLQECGRKIADG